MADQVNPLDALAAEAAAFTAAPTTAQDAAHQEAEAEAAHAAASLEAGIVKVVLGLFKVLRAMAVKRLPELADEWPDTLLQAPADAAVPLLKKHLDKLLTFAGEHQEVAVFLFSMIPLAMGYMNAMDKQAARTVTPAHDGNAAA